MKAFLIQPKEDPVVTEVDVDGDWRAIAQAIGCEWITTVRVNGTNICYVDDEGRLNGAAQRDGVFMLRDYEQPLVGKGLVLGVAPDGESKDCSLSLDGMLGMLV